MLLPSLTQEELIIHHKTPPNKMHRVLWSQSTALCQLAVLFLKSWFSTDPTLGGPAQKTWLFSNGPKIIFEWSSLLYLVWISYPESFVKKNWTEPSRWVRQTFIRDKWAERFLDFAVFYSCVPLVLTQIWYFKHLIINDKLLWLNNQ